MNANNRIYIHLSPVALGVRLFLIMFLIDTTYALLFMGFFFFSGTNASAEISSTFITFLWIAHTIKFIVIAYFLIKFLTDYLETRYTVTKSHLLVEVGAVTAKTYEYELNQLKEINIFQGPLGKALNYGDMELQFGALGFHKTVRLREISNPKKYQEQLNSFLNM